MHRLHAAILAAALVGWLTPSLAAQTPDPPPDKIPFQGYLTDDSGNPITDTVQLTFKLYDSSNNLEWTGTHTTVSVSGGSYSVMLGEINDSTALNSLLFDEAYSLGITVGTDSEMTPRLALGTSPYAFRAKYADSVTDGVYTTGSYSDPGWITSLSASKLSGTVAAANGGTELDTSATAAGALLFTSATGTWAALAAGTNGQVLKMASGIPTWSSDADSGGTVTSVASGTGLTGGPITASGTLSIDTAVVPRLGAANTFSTGTQLIQTGAAGTIGLAVQGAASQSANLMEFRNSAGGVLAYVDSTGYFSGDIAGNAATVTNGVYTTGTYSNPSWITSLLGSKISGDISGNAANVTGVVAVVNGGTGSSTQNFVDLSTTQTVAGDKTFSGNITFNGYVGSNVSATADNSRTLGTTLRRWQKGYFGPSSVHVIANDEEAGGVGLGQNWSLGVQVAGEAVPGSLRMGLAGAPVATMNITPAGRVGIGTADPLPDGRLDVRGNIKLGDNGALFAASGNENLLTLRGVVDAEGTTVEPVDPAIRGFESRKINTGHYEIKYSAAFTGIAIPAVSALGNPIDTVPVAAVVTTIDPALFEVKTYVDGNLGDNAFSFIVTGPR